MEQIVLLAIFLLAGLINAIIRWRQQSRQVPAPGTEPPPLPPRTRELPPRTRERPLGVRVSVPAPLPAAPVPAVRRPPVPGPRTPPRRRPVHRWLGRRADVRRAIVVMTVLGPCRALEPEPGIRRPGPAGP